MSEESLIQFQTIDDFLYFKPKIARQCSIVDPFCQVFLEIPPSLIKLFTFNIISIFNSISKSPKKTRVTHVDSLLSFPLSHLSNVVFTGNFFSIIEKMITKDDCLWAEPFMNAAECIPLEEATHELRNGMIRFFWQSFILMILTCTLSCVIALRCFITILNILHSLSVAKIVICLN